MARSLRSFHGRRARSGRTEARAAASPRSTIDHQPSTMRLVKDRRALRPSSALSQCPVVRFGRINARSF
jgi:hypothetical protein